MQKIVIKEGMLISDNGRIGVIVKEIKAGTWSENPLFNWRTNYEIFYANGDTQVIGERHLITLIEDGRVVLIPDGKNS